MISSVRIPTPLSTITRPSYRSLKDYLLADIRSFRKPNRTTWSTVTRESLPVTLDWTSTSLESVIACIPTPAPALRGLPEVKAIFGLAQAVRLWTIPAINSVDFRQVCLPSSLSHEITWRAFNMHEIVLR